LAAARHAAVAELVALPLPRRWLATELKHTVDLERIAARVALVTARPRDLSGLRDTLRRLPAIATAVTGCRTPLFERSVRARAIDPAWTTLLERAIAEEPAAMLRDGNVIARGYDSALDELREIKDGCGAFLVELETRERERTGIASLKVEYNRVHGFYIEVTHANAERVPDDYRRRQTLKNAERYITPELKAFEDKALSAEERALSREKALFDALLGKLAPAVPALQEAALALATLDVLSMHAEHARTHGWSQPAFVASAGLSIRRGRHPVVEMQVEHFIPNDLSLAPARRLLIVTGPN